MINLDLSVLIDRPVGEVFAFVNKMNNAPQWQTQIVSIQQVSGGPIRVGTLLRTTGEMMARRMRGKAEVTDHEPNSKSGSKLNTGPVQVQASADFKPARTATQLSLNVQADPGGAFGLAEGVITKQLRSSMAAKLARLRPRLRPADRRYDEQWGRKNWAIAKPGLRGPDLGAIRYIS